MLAILSVHVEHVKAVQRLDLPCTIKPTSFEVCRPLPTGVFPCKEPQPSPVRGSFYAHCIELLLSKNWQQPGGWPEMKMDGRRRSSPETSPTANA